MNFTGEIEFLITGMTPAPQGSKSQDRNGRMYEANKKLPAWRRLMVAQFKATVGADWEAWGGGLYCGAVFRIPKPPTSKFPGPLAKPDTDKLQRAVGDALTIAGVITDDSRIIHWNARKEWTLQEPGAYIVLRQIEGM
jgi:Holliday junction resolvase RusA-like endonuclease